MTSTTHYKGRRNLCLHLSQDQKRQTEGMEGWKEESCHFVTWLGCQSGFVFDKHTSSFKTHQHSETGLHHNTKKAIYPVQEKVLRAHVKVDVHTDNYQK